MVLCCSLCVVRIFGVMGDSVRLEVSIVIFSSIECVFWVLISIRL